MRRLSPHRRAAALIASLVTLFAALTPAILRGGDHGPHASPALLAGLVIGSAMGLFLVLRLRRAPGRG